MRGFEAGGAGYRCRRLNVIEQWSLLQTMLPVYPALAAMGYGLRLPGLKLPEVSGLLAPLSEVSDDALSRAFGACLNACERKAEKDWDAVPDGLPLADLMTVAMAVVSENFGAFFALERAKVDFTSNDSKPFRRASLPNGEDWLWRPVLRGVFRGEGLFDGSLRLEHVARANDALDVMDENEARARKVAE